MKSLLKQLAFASLAVFNRLLDMTGQGDSILVELQIKDTP